MAKKIIDRFIPLLKKIPRCVLEIFQLILGHAINIKTIPLLFVGLQVQIEPNRPTVKKKVDISNY